MCKKKTPASSQHAHCGSSPLRFRMKFQSKTCNRDSHNTLLLRYFFHIVVFSLLLQHILLVTCADCLARFYILCFHTFLLVSYLFFHIFCALLPVLLCVNSNMALLSVLYCCCCFCCLFVCVCVCVYVCVVACSGSWPLYFIFTLSAFILISLQFCS